MQLREVLTTWAGESLVLFAERALFWERAGTLIIADPHFGKAATFRAAGIPVPSGTTAEDLARLDALLARTGAARLLILGDFFHTAAGRAEGGPVLAALGEWRARYSALRVTLIRGNHDAHAGDPPAEWGFELVPDCLVEPPFLFCHDQVSLAAPGPGRPQDAAQVAPGTTDRAPDLFTLSGHIHPAVRLVDRTGAALRLPCFHFGRRSGLLPAFGSFTGSAIIRPRPGDQVFVLGDGEILQVPTRRAA